MRARCRGPVPAVGKGGGLRFASCLFSRNSAEERARRCRGSGAAAGGLCLSCLLTVVVPVLTLLWARALCQVPRGIGADGCLYALGLP